MLEVCDTLEDSLLIKMGVEFGLRRSDITNLMISDAHIEERMLYFIERKKGNRIRKLPIRTSLLVGLKQFINTIRDRKTLFSFKSDKTAYNRVNEIYCKAGYSKKIVTEKNGVKKTRFEPSFPFHALRGTCYKRLRAEGRSLEFAAAWLGDTVAVATEHYGTVTDAELEDAIRKEDL